MTILEESVIQFDPRVMARRAHPVISPRARSTAHLHVMQIVRALAIAAGKLEEAKEWEPFTDEHYPTLPAMGCFWEEGIASYRKAEHGDAFEWQPGELIMDGIAGNPDGILRLDPHSGWEAKLTLAKVKPIGECWSYIKQQMCYLHMAGLRRTQFDICWLLGDYSRPFKPIATRHIVEFQAFELEMWWGIVCRSAKEMSLKSGILA